MARLVLAAWVVIAVLALTTLGTAVSLCQAAPLICPANQVAAIITSATLADRQTPPGRLGPATSSLSLSLSVEPTVCLTEEWVGISVRTNIDGAKVRLLAELASGATEEIGEFTVRGSRTEQWRAPRSSGLVELLCEGSAQVQEMVWTTCYTTAVVGQQLVIQSYPCQRILTRTYKDTTSCDLRVYDRRAPISGQVTDTRNQPVCGAVVRLPGTGQSTKATSQGKFNLSSYEISGSYELQGDVPTASETVSVEAVACKAQSRTIQVPAERGVSNADFTLERCFYPAAISMSKFTLDAFSGWQEAEEYSTWQNILGITIQGPVEVTALRFGGKELSPQSFDIDSELYLITEPEMGRYFMELQGTRNGPYTVAGAATVDGHPLEEMVIIGEIEAGDTERVRLVLQSDSLEVEYIKPFPLLLVLIPAIVGLAGGLAGAYFLTGGRLRGLKKAFARAPSPEKQRAAEEKVRERAARAKEKAAREAKKRPKEKPVKEARGEPHEKARQKADKAKEKAEKAKEKAARAREEEKAMAEEAKEKEKAAKAEEKEKAKAEIAKEKVAKAEEEEKAKAEKAKAEEEEKAKAEKAKEKAAKAREEEKAKAEKDAKRNADEKARQKAEKEAHKAAEKQAKDKAAAQKAEIKARQKAEKVAKKQAETKAKEKTEKQAKAKAEKEAKKKAEKKAKETAAKAEKEAGQKAEKVAQKEAAKKAAKEAKEKGKAAKAKEKEKTRGEKANEKAAKAKEEEKAKAEKAKATEKAAKGVAKGEEKGKAKKAAMKKADAKGKRAHVKDKPPPSA